ncbi:F-box/LRR-repeat protein 17 isoform X2 [Hypanus sabinus]|uniref:F-box/LRR-repeat protein 17 isoform X2 n=1 Tax=Hypanus sabinus TaxID=79690 RepID=UPI0028C4F21A|nr:F-box/LRR-repeat protein 17 isoform X2 [Hypanus sabinus]
MGHFLSKNGKRMKKRRRKVRKNCFLRGPCMLCFIVHNTSAIDEDQLESASKLAERYTALTTTEECAKFLLSPKELSIWEEQGKSLLSSVPAKLIGPPLFRTVCSDYSEMPVCKRKCAGVQACTPCKLPRSAVGRIPETGLKNDIAQCPVSVCTLPTSTAECANMGRDGNIGDSSSLLQHPLSSLGSEDSEIIPQENLKDLRMESEPPNINELPSSILLKVFAHLSLKERCLSASLVCKYWRDLGLDFQFWKQLDLSGRQQITDDVLKRIASKNRNRIQINISDCRNISDTGVSSIAMQSPGLQKYIAYRCKQLSDISLIAIACHCPFLQKVHVGNQDKLTDESLKQLGEKCPEVLDIHFGQCYKITDEGMMALARGCPRLQKIYMQENKLAKVDWKGTLAGRTAEQQWLEFVREVRKVQDRYIPKKKRFSNGKRMQLWLTKEVKAKVKAKQWTYKEAKISGKTEEWEVFKSLQKETGSSLLKSEEEECVAQLTSVGMHMTSEAEVRSADTVADGARNTTCWGRSICLPVSFLAHLEALQTLVGLEVVCCLGA